ncbi:amine sulfotransferase isoform X2 [Pocillopora verrucosa]|uniref:amine sulfotransferase isoform X2 n=1 Tax=Pocillopora verrucosa TaxID=203993 RepID=UPI00333E480A
MASYPIIQEREGEWTSNEMIEILGFRIPAFFVYGSQGPELLCDFITNFQTKPDDVFIVSYPKSGTTWVQEIVWQIYHDGEISHKVLGDRILYIEKALLPESTHLDIKSMPSPRLFKSHLSYDAIPKSTDEAKTTCKYIYVARNPKDAAVSSYKFMGSFGTNGMNAPWEFYAKLFIEGKIYNKWSDHVLGWWKHRHDPNVLFLKYEDLQKDLQSNVRMISKFLNKPLSEEVISLITEQCTFKGMMKNVQSFTLGDKIEGPKFLCKGVVGNWKEHFTPELNQRFEKEVLAKLKGSGLEFDFEL